MNKKDFFVPIDNIPSMIFTVRNVQVMVDSDLAKVYQVETKVLNQAVKRNLDRFPKEFRFQLNEKRTVYKLRPVQVLKLRFKVTICDLKEKLEVTNCDFKFGLTWRSP